MAGYLRLQPLTTATGQAQQRLDAAADVGDFGALTVQVRTAVAGGAGSILFLQHAAVLDDEAFTDCLQISLEAVGSQVVNLPPLLRFVRWRASVSGASPTFQIDLVGRLGPAVGVLPDLRVGTPTFTDSGISLEVGGAPGNGYPPLYVKTTAAQDYARGIGVTLYDSVSSLNDFFVYFQDNGGGGANLRGYIRGDGGTGVDYVDTSDARLKDNVVDADIGDARAVIRAMRERDWDPLDRTDPKARRGRGYVAQELHAVYPDAVAPGFVVESRTPRTDAEGRPVVDEAGDPVFDTKVVQDVPWGIAPMRLIPLLTRALREQDAELADLRARLVALEARVPT